MAVRCSTEWADEVFRICRWPRVHDVVALFASSQCTSRPVVRLSCASLPPLLRHSSPVTLTVCLYLRDRKATSPFRTSETTSTALRTRCAAAFHSFALPPAPHESSI